MTDKERLENMGAIGYDGEGNLLVKGEDFHWLIKQADRVQELKEQNKRYRKALEEIRDEESEPHLFNDRQRVYTMTGRIALEALEGENERDKV